MTNRRFRSPLMMLAAMISLGVLLCGEAAVSVARAADPPPATGAPPGSPTWETWPKKPEGAPPAGTAGEAAGAKTAEGISAGTWYWIAGGAAAAILIGVAASGGGGGSSTAPAHTPAN